MPFRAWVLSDPPLHYVRLTGAIGPDDVRAFQDELMADPGPTAGLDEIYDLTGITSLELSSEDIARIGSRAGHRRSRVRTGRIAVVARGDLAFGLARMFQARMETGAHDREQATHRTLDEALAWLGVKGEVTLPD